MEHFYLLLLFMRVSLIAQLVNNLLAVQETWVQFLGQEDPLEEDMATYSSILAWRIPWTEEAVGLQSMGSQRIRHDSAAKQKYKKMYDIRLCVCLFSSLRC